MCLHWLFLLIKIIMCWLNKLYDRFYDKRIDFSHLNQNQVYIEQAYLLVS